jgi:cytochrome P450
MDIMHGIPLCDIANSSPGREFAINEIKLMLAFVLLRYDVKTKDGKRPQVTKFGALILPDMKAEIMFKERSDRPLAN